MQYCIFMSLPVDYACRTSGPHVVIILNSINTFCFTDVRKYFFSSRVIDAWNCLSDNVKSPSVCIIKSDYTV